MFQPSQPSPSCTAWRDCPSHTHSWRGATDLCTICGHQTGVSDLRISASKAFVMGRGCEPLYNLAVPRPPRGQMMMMRVRSEVHARSLNGRFGGEISSPVRPSVGLLWHNHPLPSFLPSFLPFRNPFSLLCKFTCSAASLLPYVIM